MWIVNIKLHRVEKGLNSGRLGKVPIYKVLIPAPNNYLPRDRDFRAVLVAKGTTAAIGVIKDNGDSGLGDPGLALLVNKFLEVGSANLLEIGDPKNEADGIEDVGLTGAIEPRDGVEEGIEARDHRPRGVGLETLQTDLLDVHPRFYWGEIKALECEFGDERGEDFRD